MDVSLVLRVPVSDRSLAGVIFDVDGVLVASPHERAWRESLEGLMRAPGASSRRHTCIDPARSPPRSIRHTSPASRDTPVRVRVLEYFGVPDAASRAEASTPTAKQRQIEALIAAGNFAAFADALRWWSHCCAGVPLAAASSSKNANDSYGESMSVALPSAPDSTLALGGRRTLLDVFDANVCGATSAAGKPRPRHLPRSPPRSSAFRADALRRRRGCAVGRSRRRRQAACAAVGVARLDDEALLAGGRRRSGRARARCAGARRAARRGGWAASSHA